MKIKLPPAKGLKTDHDAIEALDRILANKQAALNARVKFDWNGRTSRTAERHYARYLSYEDAADAWSQSLRDWLQLGPRMRDI